MTPENFLQWLDSEIENSAKQEKAQDYDLEVVEFCKGYGEAIKNARQKFLSIKPSQEEDQNKKP